MRCLIGRTAAEHAEASKPQKQQIFWIFWLNFSFVVMFLWIPNFSMIDGREWTVNSSGECRLLNNCCPFAWKKFPRDFTFGHFSLCLTALLLQTAGVTKGLIFHFTPLCDTRWSYFTVKLIISMQKCDSNYLKFSHPSHTPSSRSKWESHNQLHKLFFNSFLKVWIYLLSLAFHHNSLSFWIWIWIYHHHHHFLFSPFSMLRKSNMF